MKEPIQTTFLVPGKGTRFDPSHTEYGNRQAFIAEIMTILKRTSEPDVSVIDEIEKIMKTGKAKTVAEAIGLYNERH